MREKLTDHKNIQCSVDVWMDNNLGKCKTNPYTDTKNV